MKLWLHYAKASISAWSKWGCKWGWRCSKCKRWRWAEELVINFGWCDRCLDTSYSAYLKSQGVEL